MSELIAMCVQEEERLKVGKPDVAYVTATSAGKREANFKIGESSKAQKTKAKGHPRCKFCHKKGHS